MPNSKHGPRGAAKKPSSNGRGIELPMREPAGLGSNLGMSTTPRDAKDKKSGKPATDQATNGEPAVPKKPDARTLIGGASWTGKLPVNMLSEQCQKRKWSKPEYTTNGSGHFGYISSVFLRHTDPKTGDSIELPPFKIPRHEETLGREPTALEARHLIATYTLFRICNMTNMHTMMPPKYKDLWKGLFTDLKKEDVANGGAWRYDSDPFTTHIQRQKDDVDRKKKAEEAKRQREKDAIAKQMSMPRLNGAKKTNNSRADQRLWEHALDVQMGDRTRISLERAIRSHAIWNPHGRTIEQTKTHAELQHILDDLSRLGFRRSHVDEAASICKDREEMLEWLLVHVPEDDLPAWTFPPKYTAGVTMVSSDVKKIAIIKRLAVSGYAADLIEEVLDLHGCNEARAASALQSRLLQDDDEDFSETGSDIAAQKLEEDEAWNDEKTVLEAIYTTKFKITSATSFEIDFDTERRDVREMTIFVRRPLHGYPRVLPIIGLKADHPSYIRLSILKKALIFAKENFLGDQMIFNIIDWISNNAEDIILNPGKLIEVSTASAAEEAAVLHFTKHSRRSAPHPIQYVRGATESLRLIEEREQRSESKAQQEMKSKRQSLPAWKLQEQIVHAVNNNQVTIISGETGSGKSTQSVQFILDDLITRELGAAANIVCTQPRRISALGLADRVADERCSKVGHEVGYIIRGESKFKHGTTKICFMTTGVLLRRLQTSGGRAEDIVASVADISHIVVDEVHERSLDTDFLLILLRDILRTRKDLKVILMSATLDADVFANYFRGTGKVARVEIQGRTFPVTDYYLDDVVSMTGFASSFEDDEVDDDGDEKRSVGRMIRAVGTQINYDLIAATVGYIDRQLGSKPGGVLIFLPGTVEIDRTLQALRRFSGLHALPLHASLMPDEQRRVFPLAPNGLRKVIAATNVAETSITIEDIVAVIDVGRVKETSFDPQNNMVKLEEVWASKAACKQRRGRAGRVSAGICYKFYTRAAEERMLERPEPEIRRVPLEQLCLSVKAMGISDASDFLAQALTPPDSLAVEGAVGLLRRMGAIDGDNLTALGRHLSVIPADLRCGKLLVYGAIFGCLESCLTIASVLSVRSPFVSPRDKRDEAKAAREPFSQGHGDLVADLNAYNEWSAVRARSSGRHHMRSWCQDNFISMNTMFDISSTRSQFITTLKEMGFLPAAYRSSIEYATGLGTNPSAVNIHNDNLGLIRALVAGAFSPQLARIAFPSKRFAATTTGAVELDPEARAIKYFNQENGRVFVHPSSALFTTQQFPGTGTAFIAYFEKVATSKVFVRQVTPFNTMSLLMFGGKIEVDDQGRGLVVDSWIALKGWSRIGVLASRLRMVLDSLLAKKIDDPGLNVSRHSIVDVVRKLIEFDGLDH